LHEHHRKLLWEKRLTSPLAITFLDGLFHLPIVNIKQIQEELKISHVAAAKLIYKFEEIGILKELTGKQRDKKYGYMEYINILSEGTKPIY
jgi:Fic family protein